MKRARVLSFVVPIMLLGLFGCNRGGGNVRHGNLSYNAEEVFEADTKALALAKAAARGGVKEINRQIAAGANVNAVGKHEITPLWWAAWVGNFDGFVALLENGANPNARRTERFPIMLLIADMKDTRFLEAALKHGGDPNLRDNHSGDTPLVPVIMNGNSKAIDLLLNAGANVNSQSPISGESLPMLAITARRDYELAYRLLEKGADPSLKDTNGKNLADIILLASVNASNNDSLWRKKVIEYMRSKGVMIKDAKSE